MSWARLFERATEHEVTTEEIRRTLETVRGRNGTGRPTDRNELPRHNNDEHR